MMWVKQKSPGFTLIELLIIIVVIAILAAIAIISYNGITERAQASKAAMAVDKYVKLLNIYKLDHGSYPTTQGLYYLCLGEASHYPAIDGFEAGQCDDSGEAGSGRVDDDLIAALSPYASPLPDPSIPAVHAGINYRGMIYWSFNDELTLIYYYLKGDVPCPRGIKTTPTPGLTNCEVRPAQH